MLRLIEVEFAISQKPFLDVLNTLPQTITPTTNAKHMFKIRKWNFIHR
jgi:hypothetical protein